MSGRPLPTVTDDNHPFWEEAARGRLVLQHCADCGDRPFYPIAPACPHCLSGRLQWKPVSGRGRVSSWVVFRKAFYPYFADRLPYAVVQVALDEGPRLNGNLLDWPPDRISVGMPVEVTFESVGDGLALPQWRPSG